jgi:hypothetical protein
MNYSAWNGSAGRRRNPALSPAHLIVDFPRTRKSRIFAHRLGKVDFSERRDIASDRQKVIDSEIGNVSSEGFKYKNVGHVYTSSEVVPRTGEEYSYEIYAHGHPLGGDNAGMESCSRSGLRCRAGAGTDSVCDPGGCVIGTLERVNDSKWRYTSSSTYGDDSLPITYYLPAEKSVALRTIVRGDHYTYGPEGEVRTVSVTSPASVTCKIYLPPKFYYSDDFIDSEIDRTDSRLVDVALKPTTDLVGVESRKPRFVQRILASAYPGVSEGFLNNHLQSPASEEIRDALVGAFEGLEVEWSGRCNQIVEEEFGSGWSGFEFVSVVFDRVKTLLGGVIQVTGSSLSAPRISYGRDSISRPVYSRLPGLAEAYLKWSVEEGEDEPARWLTSGADEFLSSKKEEVAAFYSDYLDPDTCSPGLLDWLAQHVGLFGELWNSNWDNKVKRALIKNSFGWWDREVSETFPTLGEVLTMKGGALEHLPFTNPEWNGTTDNLLGIKLDEIETIDLLRDPGSGQITRIEPLSLVKVKTYSDTDEKVSLTPTDQVTVDKSLWNGLMEAKGSLLGAVFLSSLFGLKSHSSKELEVVDAERKLLRPRTGLRSAEIDAPVLLPYKSEVLQVGNLVDASVGNYTNQLVAGVSRVSSVEDSKNVFFRVPYYYNRDGKSWDAVTYIAQNWMPSNLNVRVQYAYLSAGLWKVGDAFFEPDVNVSDLQAG